MNKLVKLQVAIALSLVIISFSPGIVESANILFYHNIASYSHRVPTYELGLALARRGHHVTLISPFKPREPIERHPNLTDITPASVEKTLGDWLGVEFDINNRVKKTIPRIVNSGFPIALQACEDLLTSPELKEYMGKTTKLDLVFLDDDMADCGVGIAYKYGAKHIFFNLITYLPFQHDFYGMHAPETSSVPETEMYPVRVPMSLADKVYNFAISLHFRYEHYKFVTELDGMVRKHLNVGEMPFLDDVARNHSLIFYNADVITDYPRSHPPNVVSVGGIHCKNMSGTETIPRGLVNFIKDPKFDGFVYISLGSLVVSSRLPDHIRSALFASIASFPKLRFLWKWNGQVPDDAPFNIYFGKWFPQQEILANPRIRGFVTQSGRQSTLEAVYHGVPMITFPVLGDQDVIADRMELVGVAMKLELGTVTEEEFTIAINEVVYGGRISAKSKDMQRIFRDRPQTPMESAIWWTEYVLRNKDMNHLRPAGFEQTWYQRRLLDVHFFLFSVILFALTTVVGLIWATIKVVRKFTAGIDNAQVKLKKK